jgi:hypothetical protein
MSDLQQRVYAMLNASVGMMKQSKPRESFVILREALKLLKTEAIDSDNLGCNANENQGCGLIAIDVSHGESAFCSISSQTSFPVYGRSFVINSVDDKMLYSGLSLDVVIAVVLYDMALSYHYYALKTGKYSFLKKSLGLYEMACQVLEPTASNVQVLQARDDISLLVLSLINNLCHVHSLFFNRDKTMWLLGKFRFTLSAVCRSNPNEDYLFFYQTFLANSDSKGVMNLAPSA